MAIVANEIFATLHCNQFIHSCSEMKSVDTLSNKENMNPMLILKQIAEPRGIVNGGKKTLGFLYPSSYSIDQIITALVDGIYK